MYTTIKELNSKQTFGSKKKYNYKKTKNKEICYS